MKYLKPFNESLDEEKYDFNEKYFELVDILQSKVFDDWNVITGTDEKFDDDDDNFPDHKFWLFSSDSEGLVSSKNLGSKIIRSVSIYNIEEPEHEDFLKALNDLRGLVEAYTGMKLLVYEKYPIVCSNKQIYAPFIFLSLIAHSYRKKKSCGVERI